MAKKMIRVLPVGTALVQHFEKMRQGVHSFVGRKWDPTHGEAGGFVPTDEAAEVEACTEYRQELQAGGLAPADDETARWAGVKMPGEKAASVPVAVAPATAPGIALADKSDKK